MEEGKQVLLAASNTKKARRWPLAAFVGSQVVTIGFEFFTLRYQDWFKYCWFKFGLLYAENIRLEGSTTIHLRMNKLYDLLCDPRSKYYGPADRYCPQFCDRMQVFEEAGGIFLFFIVLSVATATISLILHVFKAMHLNFRLKYARLVTILPFLSLLVGAIVYVSLAGFNSSQPVDPNNLCKSDKPLDLNRSLGSLFGLILIIAQLLTSLFGFQCSGKEFQRAAIN